MPALDHLKRFPDWPGRMTAPVAAAYMGVSQSTFLTRFRDVGVKEGANILWARAQLDRIVAAQFGLQQPGSLSGEHDDSWDDLQPAKEGRFASR